MRGNKAGVDVESLYRNTTRSIPVDFLVTLAQTFYPTAYPELSNRTTRNSISYVITLIIFCTIVALVSAGPLIVGFPSNVDQFLSHFDQLSINITASTREPVYIPQLHAGVDTEPNATITQGEILITKDNIQTRNVACAFLPLCGGFTGYSSVPLAEYTNLIAKKQQLIHLATVIFIIMFPVLMILIALIIAVKYLLASVLFFLFGVILMIALNRRMRLLSVLKLCFYSLTPFILAESANLPWALTLYYIPFVVSAFYLVIGILLASERGFKQ